MLGAIEASGLGGAMRNSLWLYPAVEIIHIIGFAVLFGSIAMFDLRLLGVSRSLPVRALARHLLPWTVGSLMLIVPSGLAMFSAHASDFVSNGAFLLKLVLLFAAATNAAAFHAGAYRTVDQWDRDRATPAAARMHATLSLMLWIAVIACGRLLAYL